MAVIDLLLRNVAQTPDKPAVIAADGELSFRQLDQAAGRIATRLHLRGVRRGDTVAMAMDNAEAAHFTASYFGIHKLGAIPVPMNVRWAPPEKQYVLAHSDAVALICGAEHTAHFASLSASSDHRDLKLRSWLVTGSTPVAGFEALGDLLHDGPIEVPPLAPAPGMEDPADLLYTSGTTGMPKGVLVPQGNLADQPTQPGQPSITQALAALFGERLLHAVPLFGFTGCHGLMLMCARAGITQVALPRFDPETLLASIEKFRATSIMGVPTMLNLAMKHPSLGQHDYSSLKFVFFGAAPIQPDTVRKMLQVWPGLRMLNGYGLTEGGLGAACMLGPDPQDILQRPGCVGRPAGCEAVIVDDDDRPLSQGEVGEICFRSNVSHRRYYKNAHRGAVARRDVAHRRRRVHRRGRLRLHHRPQERHDPPRRLQHLRRRGRARAAENPCPARSRRRRCSASRSGGGHPRGDRAAVRCQAGGRGARSRADQRLLPRTSG